MNNYDILVSWTVQHLRVLKADGELVVPDNSPLSSEQVTRALREIAEHPDYRSQTISVPAEDGVRSILRRKSDGRLHIETLPFADKPHPRVMPDGAALYIKDEEE